MAGEQRENRMLLQNVMPGGGFKPIDCEWRNLSPENETYRDINFEFPVFSDHLRR
ncbi:MAG: hypothetical protein IKR07_04715 [Oscillospiraceae bacterium]|nr:hypothetical protein [Oscillospiraceae bacterium]